MSLCPPVSRVHRHSSVPSSTTEEFSFGHSLDRRAFSSCKARSTCRCLNYGAAALRFSVAPRAALATSPEGSGDIVEPYGRVEDVMTEAGLKATTATATLESIVGEFELVSGLPVVDDMNIVQGVITRKDIINAKRKGLGLHKTSVGDCFSQPAVTIRQQAHVGEAAGLMLAKSCTGSLSLMPRANYWGKHDFVFMGSRLHGIVSRSDIMTPMLQHHGIYDIARATPQEPRSLQQEIDKIEREEGTWQVQYLYDGDCSMCRALKEILQNQNQGRSNIMFVDIANSSYDPQQHASVSYEDAIGSIHIIRRNGAIITGPAALRELYTVAGLGWAARLSSLPLIGSTVDAAYSLLSRYRLGVGGVDAVVAMHRLQAAEQGAGSLADAQDESL